MGCEGSTQGAVWTDFKEESFFNCPLLWVTSDIVDWYQEYSYDIEIGSPLNYHKQSSRYVEAWQIYKRFYNDYQSIQAEKRMKPKSNDSLDQMAANFMNQKRASNE